MSTLKVNTIQNTSGVEVYTAKAWVNFNGTGTVAIRASGNVSSITDNGTGNYTVNFTHAMPDANYSYSGGTHNTAGTGGGLVQANNSIATAFQTSSLTVRTGEPNAFYDVTHVTVTIFR